MPAARNWLGRRAQAPLEGDGFELPVPRSETTISASQRGNGRWRTHYIDPAFRDRAPRIVKGENGKERLVIEEQAVGDGQRGIGRIGAVGARPGGVGAE